MSFIPENTNRKKGLLLNSARRSESPPLSGIHQLTVTLGAFDSPTGPPTAQPNKEPGQSKSNNNNSEDGEAVPSHLATVLAMSAGVEEAVAVEALCLVGKIGEGEVEEENQNEEGKVDERVCRGSSKKDFEQRVETDDAVLGNLKL